MTNSQGTSGPVFTWNLITLILIGTAVCLWAGYFSDKLPEISATLGGGGVLIWAITAFSLLTSKHQEKIKHWTESIVLGSRVFTVLLIVSVFILALLANFLGSVEVQSITEEPEHSVLVYSEGLQTPQQDSEDWKRLAPAQQVRSIVWTSWWSPTQVVVKVRGYPEKIVKVHPLERVPILVPYSVQSPVVLLRPTSGVADIARGAGMKVELKTTDDRGTPITRVAGFDGHSVLIGGDEDIALPPWLEDRWRIEARDHPDLFYKWATPDAPPEFAMLLKPRQTLQVQLVQKDNKPYGPQVPVLVEPVRATGSFVQEVVLYGP
jgi:hypothetical protein